MSTITTALAAPARMGSFPPMKTAVSSSISIGHSTATRSKIEEEKTPVWTVNDITYTAQETSIADYILMQFVEDDEHPYRRRDITIGTLDDSLTISAPDNPAGTGVDIMSFPTVTSVSPVETPATADDASNDPPEGGDLDKITETTCKNVCTKGSDSRDIPVWENYSWTHNGTLITANHTVIYCDSDCIARIRSTIVDDDEDDHDDPVTAVSSAAASGATSAPSGSVKLI